MKRQCAACPNEFEARRKDQRYCGSKCRVRATRRRQAEQRAEDVPRPEGLVQSVHAELERAGKADTSLGQQALALATKIMAPTETGSAVAALSKELRAIMAELTRGAEAADPIDELQRRRDQKRVAR